MHIDIFLYDSLWYSRIVSTTLVIEDVFQKLHTKITVGLKEQQLLKRKERVATQEHVKELHITEVQSVPIRYGLSNLIH